MANNLNKAVRESRNLKDNLKPLLKIIKKINVCIALMPIRCVSVSLLLFF